MTLMPRKYIWRHSNLVNEVIFHAVQVDHVPADTATHITARTDNAVSNDTMFIPLGTGTSWFRCIDEFTSMMSSETRDSRLTYQTGTAPNLQTNVVSPSQMVFVPVKAEWQGEPWLVPLGDSTENFLVRTVLYQGGDAIVKTRNNHE